MDIKEYNGTSLAYMGDAVMSLLVREMLLAQGWQKSKILQKKSESEGTGVFSDSAEGACIFQ